MVMGSLRICNYPQPGIGTKPHALGRQYWQVDDYGDICDECHRLWLKRRPCKHPPCPNAGRYDSGYCGVCDIRFNTGRGERL